MEWLEGVENLKGNRGQSCFISITNEFIKAIDIKKLTHQVRKVPERVHIIHFVRHVRALHFVNPVKIQIETLLRELKSYWLP